MVQSDCITELLQTQTMVQSDCITELLSIPTIHNMTQTETVNMRTFRHKLHSEN